MSIPTWVRPVRKYNLSNFKAAKAFKQIDLKILQLLSQGCRLESFRSTILDEVEGWKMIRPDNDITRSIHQDILDDNFPIISHRDRLRNYLKDFDRFEYDKMDSYLWNLITNVTKSITDKQYILTAIKIDKQIISDTVEITEEV